MSICLVLIIAVTVLLVIMASAVARRLQFLTEKVQGLTAELVTEKRRTEHLINESIERNMRINTAMARLERREDILLQQRHLEARWTLMRRVLTWIGGAAALLVVLASLAAGAAYLALRNTVPSSLGALAIGGLSSPGEIVRDTEGVPHVACDCPRSRRSKSCVRPCGSPSCGC